MGGGIAYQFCVERRAGCHERYDKQVVNPRHDQNRKLLNKQLERGKIDGLKLAGVISTIHPTLDYAGFEPRGYCGRSGLKTRK
ncbi:hypothetical protein ACNKHW_24625 [Shigella flexneri]